MEKCIPVRISVSWIGEFKVQVAYHWPPSSPDLTKLFRALHKRNVYIPSLMMKVGLPNHLYVLIFVSLLLPQSAPTQVITQRVWWLTFREYSKCVTLYTIYISVAVNGPGMTSRYGVAREKRWARSQGHTEISPAKTYECQYGGYQPRPPWCIEELQITTKTTVSCHV
jgi:hypothetical protein